MRLTAKAIPALLGTAMLVAPAAMAALPKDAKAPDFTAEASKGGNEYRYSLADALKSGPVVLYFYPAAFTPGCTIEAHEFAEAIPRFKALGATVIGVSMDPIAKLKKFSVSECRSAFPVAADPDGKVTRAYEAKLPGIAHANRVSYVIAPDGHIAMAYTSMSPDEHVERALAAVTQLKTH